jgi:hypothetical protein
MSCACTSKTTVRRGVGTKFTTVRRIGRVAQTTIQEITQADPPTGWAARGVDGPFRPNAAITIEPLADGTRSLVTIAFELRGTRNR